MPLIVGLSIPLSNPDQMPFYRAPEQLHTANNNLAVMVRRPAPVQASWVFGAGQTTGLPEVDYFLCDAVLVPPEHEPYMAEAVLRLPFAGMPYKPGEDFLEPAPLPCLHAPQVVLGVLSRPLRTNRHTVRVWAQILAAVPEAVLRFDHVPYAEPDIQARMRGLFAEHGIAPDRLIFCNTRPHWQALREIDLQLDPFPAGSGTVVSDGLWMERLAVTLRSRPVMGLSATAQLTALGLADPCVAANEEEYVQKVVALVRDRERLVQLCAGLRARMQRSPLMDYASYGREVAKLYRQMWQNWCARQAGAPKP